MSGEVELVEVTIDLTELKKMKVPELKRKVSELGLSTKGTKAELLDRVEKYIHEQEEELLEEEVEEIEDVADEEEEVAGEEEEGVEEECVEEEESRDTEETTATSVPPLTVSDEQVLPEPEEQEQQTTEVKDEERSEDVAVSAKLSIVSSTNETDRLAKRAARFGGNCSEQAKKISRAERFGTALENGYLGLGKRGVPTEAELEKMKKRAGRFGSSVSPVITNVEDVGKKEKRLLRFGQSITELSVEERKKARAAKFGSS